ncbi:MAG: M23 family metallopeptidase [Nanoarchaeota archaeon]|nr:M23 family metallopeptidase [Nanoarchaeota archaeon]
MKNKKIILVLIIIGVLIISLIGIIKLGFWERDDGENLGKIENRNTIIEGNLDEKGKVLDGIENSSKDSHTESISENDSLPKNSLPVLKNLGVNIGSWNKQTNLAGDLIFSKKLLFDDGHVSNEKVFLDFGSKDKYRQGDIGAIEYWFYVPLNTKVVAPIGGRVQVVYFNHTKDWGINIVENGVDWIVSFEHLVNVVVKGGDIVKAGDIVGEAAPRSTFQYEIAMVEFVVWKGGKEIIKYCPFNFLDSDLKPVYKEKINKLASDWEEFVGKNVYEQEKWVAPGCLVESIVEK